jgi:hypothetical protein
VNSEQLRLHEDLVTLASSERGRRLLQLSLRGIARGEQDVSAGCWARRGIAGCLFQHAYWEGVREGVFADEGRPGDWIGSFVGPHDYGIVIRVIEAFDRLAKTSYSDVQARALLPDRRTLRQDAWNRAVERMLVDVLRETQAQPVTDLSGVPVGA